MSSTISHDQAVVSASSTVANATSDGMDQTPPKTPSSTLYLYTFLVTLILLFSISGIIITRSYLLRRRFRLRVEEALRNGQVLSPDVPGLVGLSTSATRKLFGPPPKLWDIWVQPAIPVRMTEMVGMMRGESQDVYEGGAEISGEFPWDAMTPLSVEIIPTIPRKNGRWPLVKPALVDAHARTRTRTDPNERTSVGPKTWLRRSPQLLSSVSPSFSAASSVPPRTIDPPIPEGKEEKLADKEPPQTQLPQPHIRVATLISMPTPPQSRPLVRRESSSSSYNVVKGKWKEERATFQVLASVAVGVTELKVNLEEGKVGKNDQGDR